MNTNGQTVSIRYSQLMVAIGALLASLAMLGGCGDGIKEAPYKVIDTGYWPAEASSLGEHVWLDNDRLTFTSTENLQPGKPPYSIKVLNTKTGQVTSTAIESIRCARHGQVVYVKKDSPAGQLTYYRGPLESAVEHPAPGPDMHMDEFFDCDWVPKKTFGRPGLHTEGKFKLLGENHIEILQPRTAWAEHERKIRQQRIGKDVPRTGSKGQMVYHAKAGDKGREIPTLFWWTYSEFFNAYISSGYYDPQDPEARSFWILQRDGDLKKVPYPKSMLEGRNDVYPVKPGYLVHYRGGPLTEKENTRGLYLIQKDQVFRLFIGGLGKPHISPDGCKVAWSSGTATQDGLWHPNLRTLKYTDFCQGGTKP